MPADPNQYDFIDAHSHIWTPDTDRYPLASGWTRELMQPSSFTAEELLAHCQPEGVRRVVLIQMSFYGFDNSYMTDKMTEYLGTFGGVAVVDWTAPRPDTEMERLNKLGVRGFRVYPAQAPVDRWTQTESFDRMFRQAANSGQAICPLIDPTALPSLARSCEQYPDTRVVIDHFCRIGIDGEIRDAEVEALCAFAQYPNVYVKISAFYALGRKQPPHDDLEPMTRRLHAAFSARRLIWASDCPFAVVNEQYRDSLSLIRDGCSWLSDEDRAQLLRDTAAEVFFD